MVDELLDSLLLDKLPTAEVLESSLDELCRGAEDIEPILHSFKNSQQLAVGVRDILGKEPIEATTGALSDVAQACLDQIAQREFDRLIVKLGQPMVGEEPAAQHPCELVILALGKFGGREMNYYSDLDLVFVYEADGTTVHPRRTKREATTTNQHFFSELGQRIIKLAGRLGPMGRLYQIDPRLRPTGRSGSLATSLVELERYFATGEGQLWERQALTKARPVFGTPAACRQVMETVHAAAYSAPLSADDARAIHEMRQRLEETAPAGNLKRGPGGLVDIEFLTQMLQLAHGHDNPALRVPDTLSALAALAAAGHLSRDDAEYFTASFRFLRTIEARLRLMSTTARDDLPSDAQALEKLASLMRYESPEGLLADCQRYTYENRQRFERIFAQEMNGV
jgi:glutamate-ammonia-ligase adenylyltransferase